MSFDVTSNVVRPAALLFDLDGTLADSFAAIRDALNAALREHGLDERELAWVRVIAPDGTVLQSLDLAIPSFGHLHIPLAEQLTDGRVEVELLGPDERAMVVSYISTVENTSGLPAHLLPERIPGPARGGKLRPPTPGPLTQD